MTTEIGQVEKLRGLRPDGPAWTATYIPHAIPHRSFFTRLADILLMLSVTLAGYHLWRIQGANLTVSDFAFVGAAGIFLAQGRVNLTPFGTTTPLWLAGLTLMLSGLFFSTLLNGDLLRWIIVAGQYLFAFFCIPIILTSLPRTDIRRLVALFVLGVVAMQLVGGIASLTLDYHTSQALLGNDFLAGNGRLGSFAGEPNWNGSLIAVSCPMLIYCIKERLLPFVVGVVCGAILIWGLLLCASATAFGSSVIAICILLLLLGVRHMFRFIMIASIFAGIFVASGAPLPSIFAQRVGGAITRGDIAEAGTFTGRVQLIGEAWRMSEDTAIVGLGVDEFRNNTATNQPVHNLYLLIWTEGGVAAIIGLLILVALMIYFPLACLRTSRAEAALAFSIVVVFLIYTTASPHIYARLSVMPLILVLALIFSRKGTPNY